MMSIILSWKKEKLHWKYAKKSFLEWIGGVFLERRKERLSLRSSTKFKSNKREYMMKSIFQRKEDAFLLISFASLKHWGEPTDKENISAEKARLERVGESFYKSSVDVEYNKFMLEWIKENAEEIVYGDSFTYDVSIPDDTYEIDVDVVVNKMLRKEKKKLMSA